MNELSLIMALLGTIAACAVLLTICLLRMSGELHRSLRRLDRVLPEAEGALREARRALRQARRLLSRGDRASRRIEAVLMRGCEVASGAIERLDRVREAAAHLFTMRTRNGTRAAPRPNHRRGS